MKSYGKKNFILKIWRVLFPKKRSGWVFINMAQGHIKQIKRVMSE